METLNDVLEQLIYLCEIRGELDPETNVRTEQKIAELEAKYRELSKEIA